MGAARLLNSDFAREYMRTVLITGVAGFTGSHLVRRLRRDHDIRIVGIDCAPVRQSPDAPDVCLQTDLADTAALRSTVTEFAPAWVFHLAGRSSGMAEALYEANLMNTVRLLEVIKEHLPQCAVLLIGSAAEYGRAVGNNLPFTEHSACQPMNAYGISKHAMTMAALDYVRHYGLKVVIARPFNIVGAGIPRNLVAGAILSRIRESLQRPDHPPIQIGNTDSVRDFVAVEDAVNGYVRLLECGQWGEVFNICSGRGRRIGDIVDMLLAQSPVPLRVEVDPALVRSSEVDVSFGSYAKAREAIGFEPVTPLESALHAAWLDLFDQATTGGAKCQPDL